jgi:hypothetical protein
MGFPKEEMKNQSYNRDGLSPKDKPPGLLLFSNCLIKYLNFLPQLSSSSNFVPPENIVVPHYLTITLAHITKQGN